MLRAIELASRARGRTSPNPMVGAVLVRKGRVVGEGFHSRAGEAHAEVLALDEAGEKARGADLYVNLEPCSHQGRTPPCTVSIIRAGVGRVFAAIRDPNPLVAGGGGAQLRRAGIPVHYGLAGKESRKLNEAYLKYMRTGLPFVILKVAQSLDGKIGTRTGNSRWITGATARQRAHEIRNAVDAVMVGVGTVVADDPRLTTRLSSEGGRHARRVVVDPLLRSPHRARVFEGGRRAGTIVFTTGRAPSAKIARVRRKGVDVQVIPGRRRRMDMKLLMERLGTMGVTSVMIEGGGETAASALEAGVVDKVICFMAPLIIGGRKAPTSVGGEGAALVADALRVEELTVTKVGADILIEGYLGEGG